MKLDEVIKQLDGEDIIYSNRNVPMTLRLALCETLSLERSEVIPPMKAIAMAVKIHEAKNNKPEFDEADLVSLSQFFEKSKLFTPIVVAACYKFIQDLKTKTISA